MLFLIQTMTAACYRLLESILERASHKSIAHARYLYGAVLPVGKVQVDAPIPELHFLLKEEQEHRSTALSLSASILQHAISPDAISQLEQLAKDRSVSTVERALPLLSLRMLLADVANDLEETQCETLVGNLARMKLDENPDCSVSPNSSCFESLLSVFVRMEQQQLLVAGDHQVLCVRKLLEKIGRKDVISKYLDAYDPNQPFNLFVMESEGMCWLLY